jgi:hypothetical protein
LRFRIEVRTRLSSGFVRFEISRERADFVLSLFFPPFL